MSQRPFVRRTRETASAGDEPHADISAAGAPLNTGSLERGTELLRSISVAAEQVDQVITAAHELAEQIRAEAESEAARYLEARKREADRIVAERISGGRSPHDAGIMNRAMAELRFRRHERGSLREPVEDAAGEAPSGEPPRGDDPGLSDLLAEIAAQVDELDAAAERAAHRIADAGERMRGDQIVAGQTPRADLLAGLASALIERTDEIRAECEHLAALIERTANLIAASEAKTQPEGHPHEAGPPRSERR